MAKKPVTKSKAAASKNNGSSKNTDKLKDSGKDVTPKPIDPEVLKKIGEVRSQVRENFGKVTMTMMALPRYRNLPIADLQHLILEPLIRDRIAIAYPGKKDQSQLTDISGLAIWASVSKKADAKIREQIKAGAFPVRLTAEEWTSGDINWLLDVIAPDAKMTASVISNFRQVVKEGSLHLHPLITRLVDDEVLKKMGAAPIKSEKNSEDA